MSDKPYRHAFDSILIEQLQKAILEISGERDTARVERDTARAASRK